MADDGDSRPGRGMELLGKTAGGFAGMAIGAQAADFAMEKLGMPGEPVSMLGAAAIGAFSGYTLGGKNPYKANLILGGAVVAYAAREHMRDRMDDLNKEIEQAVNKAFEDHGLPPVASDATGSGNAFFASDWHDTHGSATTREGTAGDPSDVLYSDASDQGLLG